MTEKEHYELIDWAIWGLIKLGLFVVAISLLIESVEASEWFSARPERCKGVVDSLSIWMEHETGIDLPWVEQPATSFFKRWS